MYLLERVSNSNQGKCRVNDGIIVWDPSTVTHLCPYEVISDLNFVLESGNLAVGLNNSLVFEITERLTVCKSNFVIYKTSEGIYLQLEFGNNLPEQVEELNQLPITNTQFNTPYSIMLAEEDKFKKKSYETHKEFNFRSCNNFINSLTAISSIKDEFHTILDYNGNELTLYSDKGQIFLANCEEAFNVSTPKTTDICYNEIPVIFSLKNTTNKTKTGFMNRERTIRRIGKKKECDLNAEIILLDESHIIYRKGKNSELITKGVYERVKLSAMIHDLSQENYKHSNLIFDNLELIKQWSKINPMLEKSGTFMIAENAELARRVEKKNLIFEFISNIDLFSTFNLIIISSTLFLILLISLSIFFITKRFKSYDRRCERPQIYIATTNTAESTEFLSDDMRRLAMRKLNCNQQLRQTSGT